MRKTKNAQNFLDLVLHGCIFLLCRIAKLVLYLRMNLKFIYTQLVLYFSTNMFL